jgi:hypothetical protein
MYGIGCQTSIAPNAFPAGRVAVVLLTLLVGGSGLAKELLGDPGLPTVAITGSVLAGDEPAVAPQPGDAPKPAAAGSRPTGDPVPLNPQKTVLIDAARKRLLLKTQVVLREGVLEMFACLAGTKEHESVVSVECEAYVIHAGLLAIGAKPGKPVQFEPEYRPPQGQPIDIFVNWTDENGRPHRRPAQHWVRHVTRRYYLEPLEALPADLKLPEDGELRYDKKRQELIWFGPMSEQQRDELLALSEDAAYRKNIHKFFTDSQPREMEAEFVFAGSGFHEDADGKRYYLAESGNIICVANFTDAIIDVAVKSLAANDALLFEPYTERIPPLGTAVTIELVPLPEKQPQPN